MAALLANASARRPRVICPSCMRPWHQVSTSAPMVAANRTALRQPRRRSCSDRLAARNAPPTRLTSGSRVSVSNTP